MRILAVLTLKNEGAFFLEWLAHHQMVGFTDFLVLTNDCDDGTDLMMDRLDEMGLITHLPNPGPYEKPIQITALERASAHPMVFGEADWIMHIDVDEFVNIHVGDGTFGALFQALPDAQAITLTWRFFGNDGVEALEDRPVTEKFTRAAPKVMHWPWRASMFKTIFKNDGVYSLLGIHRPEPAESKGAAWYDGSGRRIDLSTLPRRIFSKFGRNNHQLVQLNHYALGSMQDYLIKVARGRVHLWNDSISMDYWTERNYSTVPDPSIKRYADLRRERQADLMADPRLAELHSRAFAWRKAKFEELIEKGKLRRLYSNLLVAPPSVPVSKEKAVEMRRYGRRGIAEAKLAD